ncbi:DMT family transporter [Diplocloster hominis]|uniref:DMT family transporter n=1 Tax=Diplocloster hominis TaxID=3079010 RepID=UPI0031BA2EEC
MKSESRAKATLITAMLLFGSIGLFVKGIPLSSAQIAFTRGFIGCLILLAFGCLGKQKMNWSRIRSNLPVLFASGAAIALNWIFLFQSYHYTTVQTATVCYYFAPVIVTLVSPFLLKERLTPLKVFCIAAAAVGMFLVAGAGGKGPSEPVGIVCGLLAALFYASVVVLNKFQRNLTGTESTFVQLAVAALCLLPYVLATGGVGLGALRPLPLFLLLFIGVVHTGIGYLLYFSSLHQLKGQTAAAMSYIDPVSALLMAGIFLGERMTGIQLIGACLVLGAAFASEYKK